MKYDVLTIGGVVFDLFIRPEKEKIIRLMDEKEYTDYLAFPHGAKLEIDEMHMEFGGGAANSAVNLSTMGFSVCVNARVGDDYYGKEILRNLKSHGVDTRSIEVIKKERSGFSVILNSFDGDRTVLYTRGANGAIPTSRLVSLCGNADAVHITSLPKGSDGVFKKVLAHKKKRKGFRISWNPGYHQLVQGMSSFKGFLKHVSILTLNKEEITQFTRTKVSLYSKKVQRDILLDCKDCLDESSDTAFQVYDVSKAAAKLLKAGVEMVVVTDGKRGSQMFSRGVHYYMPAGHLKPIATLGAGDAFASAFLAGIMYDGDARKALQFATYNAGSVVSEFGAQRGILTYKQLTSRLDSFPVLSL